MDDREQQRKIRHRLAVLRHAEEVTRNVAATCRYYGISRQCFYKWLRRYEELGEEGLRDRSSAPLHSPNATDVEIVGLVDGSPVPASCPHQMPAVIEARIIEMRHDHPGWGPRTIGHQLAREGFDPVPAKTSIYRALVRHQFDLAGRAASEAG